MTPVPKSRYVLFLAIVTVGVAVDLGTKHWAFSRLGAPGPDARAMRVLDDVLRLETSLNEGALFGMGQGGSFWFAGLSCVAAVGICYWLFVGGAARDLWLTVALASVMAGIGGNLYDRLGLPGLTWNYPVDRIGEPVYAVRDWIHFQIEGLIDWPIFNVADMLLVCGATLLAVHALWIEGRRATADTADRSLSS